MYIQTKSIINFWVLTVVYNIHNTHTMCITWNSLLKLIIQTINEGGDPWWEHTKRLSITRNNSKKKGRHEQTIPPFKKKKNEEVESWFMYTFRILSHIQHLNVEFIIYCRVSRRRSSSFVYVQTTYTRLIYKKSFISHFQTIRLHLYIYPGWDLIVRSY